MDNDFIAKVLAAGQENCGNAPRGVKHLVSWMIEKLPLKNPHSKYGVVLQNHLTNFKNHLQELDAESTSYLFPSNSKDYYLNLINKYCSSIEEVIQLNSKGQIYLACTKFRELMTMNNTIGGMAGVLRRKTDSGTQRLFRIRKIVPSSSVSQAEMFHIPYTSRGKVASQRYSSPGYPCLYLGYSINACWEELERPALNSFMVVGVHQQYSINIIDLSVPNDIREFHYISDLWQFIMTYPLTSACMVKVSQSDNDYKEEYVIPQMLTNYVIEQNLLKRKGNNMSEEITAIKYTSSCYNKQFGWGREAFANLAVPAVHISSEYKYCPVLSNLFYLSTPTCVEYEQISNNLVEAPVSTNRTYENSLFGRLESVFEHREYRPVKYTK